MPPPIKTAKEIFLEAADLAEPSSRNRYLNEACAGDADLRRHVEALLRVHDEPDSLLDQERIPAPLVIDREASPPTLDQPQERPGTQTGPYKLLQQIGEGGMGVVFMAEQHEPVKRRVALKIIKPGMDTRQVIARFEAERQALSLMDHPNIAKVLDAGATDSGRPYFVMELVKGQPITQYCDEKHLTPRQRLELLLPVCHAIQHAHQKGIIHRDIKPTNILVAEYDQQPVPKVIDFGVAKATSQTLTEKTMFTGLGQIVGTLEYMSPEQAKVNQLDIDTRSDIYSLGVLLYELLTGSTPFDRKRLRSAAFDEMLRIIREEEPPKPSTRLSDSHDSLPSISAQRHTEPAKLTKLVRGELDWIVMKALEKDRNRRYETANGFAADVQRYLADEPVHACPPSQWYRLGKSIRRNKTGLAVAALVLTFLVLLGSGAGWALRDRQAREDELAKEAARKLAQTQQDIREALERAIMARSELSAALKKTGGLQELLAQPTRWKIFLNTARVELGQAQLLMARAEGNRDAGLTQALARLEQEVASDESDYQLLVVGGDAKSSDPGRTVALAAEAEALDFSDPGRSRALGVAHYRAGNWNAAIEALSKSRSGIHSYYGRDSVTLFYLSMACGRLNDTEQARRFFDEAAQWRMGLGCTEEEVRHLCGEAAALLHLEVPPTLREPPALMPGPTLLQPAGGTTLGNSNSSGTKLRVWEFDWSDVPGATQYDLNVMLATVKLPIRLPTILTSSSYRHEARGYIDNRLGVGCRWKVRALVEGKWTDWSEERLFDLAAIDETPIPGKLEASP